MKNEVSKKLNYWHIYLSILILLTCIPIKTKAAFDWQPEIEQSYQGGCCEWSYIDKHRSSVTGKVEEEEVQKCMQLLFAGDTGRECERLARSLTPYSGLGVSGFSYQYYPNKYCHEQTKRCFDVDEAWEYTGSIPKSIPYHPQVSIPNTSWQAGNEIKISGDTFPQYIVWIYKFGVWLAISLSIFMVMVGGFLWMLAGGSPERVTNAKSYIAHALTGLVLALLSYTILNAINPQLVQLQMPIIKSVIGVQELCCCYTDKDNQQTCEYKLVPTDVSNVQCPDGGQKSGDSYCRYGGNRHCCCWTPNPFRPIRPLAPLGAAAGISSLALERYYLCTPQSACEYKQCPLRQYHIKSILGTAEVSNFEYTNSPCGVIVENIKSSYADKPNELEVKYIGTCPKNWDQGLFEL